MTNPSELLRRYFEAYNAHDASALGRLVGDKITLSRPGQSASGRDETVSTSAIEDFAGRLRAGSHLIIAGARHEMMMETDRYRAQFWAAFDAFVPGTPMY